MGAGRVGLGILRCWAYFVMIPIVFGLRDLFLQLRRGPLSAWQLRLRNQVRMAEGGGWTHAKRGN